MPQVPVVKINDPNNKGSYIVINEEDYDSDKHSLWEEAKAKEPEDESVEESNEEEQPRRRRKLPSR